MARHGSEMSTEASQAMENDQFDVVVRRIGRRGAVGGIVVLVGGMLTGHDVDAKRKKRKKNKGKSKGCVNPYFTCGDSCRLLGACCDANPETSCVARNPNEPGTNWVCCALGSYCADLSSEDFNCGACGRRCESGKHCLNGECMF